MVAGDSTLTLTPAQAVVLEDVLDRFEEIAEADVHEFGDRPPAYLDRFGEVHGKVRALAEDNRRIDKLRAELLRW